MKHLIWTSDIGDVNDWRDIWLGLEDWKRDVVEAADQWESYKYYVIHKPHGAPTYIVLTDSITGDVLDVETLTEFITNTELYIQDEIAAEEAYKEWYNT